MTDNSKYYSPSDKEALNRGVGKDMVDCSYEEYECINRECNNRRLIHCFSKLPWESFEEKHQGYYIGDDSKPNKDSGQEFYPAMDFWICSKKCSDKLEHDLVKLDDDLSD